jgi:hypothetical protein
VSVACLYQCTKTGEQPSPHSFCRKTRYEFNDLETYKPDVKIFHGKKKIGQKFVKG